MRRDRKIVAYLHWSQLRYWHHRAVANIFVKKIFSKIFFLQKRLFMVFKWSRKRNRNRNLSEVGTGTIP
jgi:hypothetical protein